MALAKKPKTLKNTVNPLDWKIPIVNKNGTPTDEFMRKWLQQAVTNSTIVDLTTAAGVSAVLDLITAVAGSLLVRGAVVWQGLPPASDATKFLNGAATPAYAKVKDTDLAVTDVTGNNVSTAAHGFAPKAPNDATMFLNGLGAYSVPASGSSGAPASIQDDGTTVFIALSDTDGQLVLDGSGDPVFSPEVFPPSALPLATSAAVGAVKVDGITIAATAGVIATKFSGAALNLNSNQSIVDSTDTVILLTANIDTQSAYNPATGKYTPVLAGRYLISWSSQTSCNTTASLSSARIRKNGTAVGNTDATNLGAVAPAVASTAIVNTIVNMNGSTDYIEFVSYLNGTGGGNKVAGGTGANAATYATISYLGP